MKPCHALERALWAARAIQITSAISKTEPVFTEKTWRSLTKQETAFYLQAIDHLNDSLKNRLVNNIIPCHMNIAPHLTEAHCRSNKEVF